MTQTENIYDVSLLALRSHTKTIISTLLNPFKLFPTDRHIPRDWQGLAHLVGIGGETIPSLQNSPDKTKAVLNMWYDRDKELCTVQKLLEYFEELDRYDIIADIRELLDEDINIFKHKSTTLKQLPAINLDADEDILTTEDSSRLYNGLQLQNYDAFVLFADEDVDFGGILRQQMEDFGLRICTKEDLVPGAYTHTAIMQLIAKRCNRLVAIFSPAFFSSSANMFFCSYAQAVGFENKNRKIVPCLYKPCQDLPKDFKYMFMLNYPRSGLSWNFWAKLRDSILAPNLSYVPMERVAVSARPPSHESETENGTLKLTKEHVKFSSMVNLSRPEEQPVFEAALRPSPSRDSVSTTASTESKKSKSRIKWLKNVLNKKEDNADNGIKVKKKKLHNFFKPKKVAEAS